MAVTWTVGRGNKRRLIRVEWQETGGPPVRKPATGGFGTTLIETAIPGATVKRELSSAGLTCIIELELPEAVENAALGSA